MAIFKRLKKPDLEKEKELHDQIEAEGGLEKNDFLAMCIGAALVILPVAAIALGVMVLLIWLMM